MGRPIPLVGAAKKCHKSLWITASVVAGVLVIGGIGAAIGGGGDDDIPAAVDTSEPADLGADQEVAPVVEEEPEQEAIEEKTSEEPASAPSSRDSTPMLRSSRPITCARR